MCGIGAYVGKVDEISEMKIKLLHTLLSNRGEDGAGISYMDTSGKISFSKNSGSSIKLVETYAFKVESLVNACVTLHARKSSVGASSKENAHPFMYGHYKEKKHRNKKNNSEKKYYKFSIVHNGTIKNWKELFDKYNTNKDIKSSDFNVDSKALGHLLYYNWDKASEILKDYIGGAALICSAENKIMFFRGESKDTYHSKSVTEERPLYYSITKNGIWAASEEEYLKTIRCPDKSIKEVPANKILIYDTTTFELLEEIDVDRSQSLQNDYTPSTSNNRGGYNYGGYGTGYNRQNGYGSYGGYGGYSDYGTGWEESNDWVNRDKTPSELPTILLSAEEKQYYCFRTPVYWSSSYNNFVCYCSINLESFIISADGKPLISTREWLVLSDEEKKSLSEKNSNYSSEYYNLLDNYLKPEDYKNLASVF